jgi:hypothetical protein
MAAKRAVSRSCPYVRYIACDRVSMRQRTRDSARESAPGALIDPRPITNTRQACETAVSQRPDDRIGRQQNAGILFGEIDLNGTTLQASIGYSRVWTQGYCFSSWQVPSIPRNGSVRPLSGVTGPPGEIGKTAVHNAQCKIAVSRTDWNAGRAAAVPTFIDCGASFSLFSAIYPLR